MIEILKSHPDFLYEEHITGIWDYVKQRCDNLNLNLTLLSYNDFKLLIKLIILSHDFGKCTSYFQDYIRGKMIERERLKEHALISSFFSFCLINSQNSFQNTIFPYVGAFIVRKHHGDLDEFSKCLEIDEILKKILLEQLEDLKNNNYDVIGYYNKLLNNLEINNDLNIVLKDIELKIKDFNSFGFKILLHKNKENSLELFLIIELLYSLLLDGDKKHASGILKKNKYFNFKNLDSNLVENYIQKQKNNNQTKFNNRSKINILKDKFFYICNNNIELKTENKIYSITAPTGIGKTFTSFGVALKLRNILGQNYKIHYLLPFTSVIDQNYEEFCKILRQINDFEKFENDYILKHHYLTIYDEKLSKENYSSDSYGNNLLIINSWDSEIVVSTYVQFMHTILGGNKKFMNKFHNICNSIIILDEVQTIALKYWDLTRKIFKELSEKFGVYFIFLTATQPLIFQKNEIVELGKPERFFIEEEFNRVNFKIKIDEKIEISDLFYDFIKSFKENPKNRYLFILNTKKSSLNLFNNFKENYNNYFQDYDLIYLSTNLTLNDRNKSFKKLKYSKKYIVVTTQLVEAGVDISSDVCYRDFAPIDSIIQSAGRCNRYNELKKINEKGEMYIINLVEFKDKKILEYSSIYNSILKETTKNILKNHDFGKNNIFDISKYFFDSLKGKEHSEDLERNGISIFNFEYIQKNFKFIDSYPTEEIFILNDESLTIFNQFKKNLTRCFKNKWERKEKLKQIRKKMKYYTIAIPLNKKEEINHLFDKSISEYFLCLNLFQLKDDIDKTSIYNSEVGFNLNYDFDNFI